MKKNVIINIVSKQEIDGGKDKMEFTTSGTLSVEDGLYSIAYKEEDGEYEGCVTTVKVHNKDRISLRRTGPYNSYMVIEKGQRHLCHYNTPYGDLYLGIYAEYINSKVSESGGEFSFKYTIDINSSLASRNEVNITVKEMGIQNVESCQ